MQKNSKPKENAGKRIVHGDTSVFGAKTDGDRYKKHQI